MYRGKVEDVTRVLLAGLDYATRKSKLVAFALRARTRLLTSH